MKITKLTRKLAASLVAGGLMIPTTVDAASLDTNLLQDPGFEQVDNGIVGDYGSLGLTSWTDGSAGTNYTYASGQYDLGGPLVGGGERYFTSNGGTDKTQPGDAGQLVDLSSGDAAAAIATGLAEFELSGYMTSYAGADFAELEVDFRDVGGASLGSAGVVDLDNTTWTLNSVSGSVPVGTVAAFVSIYGDANNGGPDGYIDNVSFTISQVPEPGTSLFAGLGIAGAGVIGIRRRLEG